MVLGYTLDENTFPFNSRTVYFTNPGHIKSYEINEVNDAYIITLNLDALKIEESWCKMLFL
jgi:hypothetical protein